MATAEDTPTVKALSLGTAAVAASATALPASVVASATAVPASVAASATGAASVVGAPVPVPGPVPAPPPVPAPVPEPATGAASVAGAAAAVVRNGEQLTEEHPGSDLRVPAASFSWQQALRVVGKEERTK